MKTVDSDALAIVTRALGLTGVGAPLTEFLDASLDQVLDVVPLVRRGRTHAGTGGVFVGNMQNTHAAGDTQVSSFQPYTAATGAIAPYPTPMPAGFDVWILGASVRRVSGTGTIGAHLNVGPPDVMQGWGIDQAGAAVVGLQPIYLAHWDAVVITGAHAFLVTPDGNPWVPIGHRLMRSPAGDTALEFVTTASAVSVYACMILLGVFPISLGQDISA